jgi:cytochrome b
MAAAGIRVWDPLVRSVHWGIAVLVAVDMLNEAGANPWHRYFGYAAGVLVALRLAWGMFGSHHARLRSMAANARTLPNYLAELRSGRHRFYAGHNPLGALMAFTLWGLLIAVVATGWMLQLNAYWGDETVRTVHKFVAYTLTGCAVVHVAGVLATSLMTRVNLVKAIVTGVKTDPHS